MNNKDLLHETTSALLGNKVRSGLTMLGIIIGIASVIAMLAIGAGAQGSIQSSIQSLGSNLIEVSPGATRTIGSTVSAGRGTAQTLLLTDSDAIQTGVSNVEAIAPEVDDRLQVVAGGENTNTEIVGTVPAYTAVRDLQVAEGTFFSAQQNTDFSKVAVLGPTVVTDLFGTEATSSVIGQTIKVDNINFTVIGITVAKGGNGFGSQDDMIFVPISVVQHYMTGGTYVSSINVEASSASAMTQVQNDITTLLLQRHKISNPANADFSTLNQSDIVSAASGVTSTFTILLASVAGISLVVGGIGIMNMMLTTVTERTREIGLRKAVGAQKKDITKQFLVESLLLTFVGGTIGVILGCSLAIGVTALGIIAAQISVFSIVLAFTVSAAIGIVFGYYPAKRASSLNPIQALRYE
jgi:putative ABC transport system permease protein